jgi:hypothetical protein
MRLKTGIGTVSSSPADYDLEMESGTVEDWVMPNPWVINREPKKMNGKIRDCVKLNRLRSPQNKPMSRRKSRVKIA